MVLRRAASYSVVLGALTWSRIVGFGALATFRTVGFGILASFRTVSFGPLGYHHSAIVRPRLLLLLPALHLSLIPALRASLWIVSLEIVVEQQFH